MRPIVFVLLAACSGAEPPPPPPPAPPPAAKPPPKKVDTGQGDSLNRAPQLGSISFEPPKPTTLDALRVVATATDPDGDRVDVDYRWSINEQERFEFRDQVLPARAFKKGDAIEVEVTASDGAAETVRTSATLTIANSLPHFVTDPNTLRDIDGFRLEAADEDQDRLTYSLQGAPDGMSIDKDLGVLRYKGTEDEPGGAYKITVIAEDVDGGRAGWTFGIELSPGSAAAKKAKETAAGGR
ncbi:MAG: hypothetical protein VX265_16795 [Myxococcota bacterium]|nr:hypothetical protein [Myxococcota bacterium]